MKILHLFKFRLAYSTRVCWWLYKLGCAFTKTNILHETSHFFLACFSMFKFKHTGKAFDFSFHNCLL